MKISSSSYNNVFRDQQDGKLIITKEYAGKERFYCEIENLKRFSSLGFVVPQIIEIDDKNMILKLEGIEGEVKEKLSPHEMERCVDVLVDIMKKHRLDNSTYIAKRYSQTVRKNITKFANEINQSIVESRLISFLKDVEVSFVPSLFKDAKPTNWVFRVNRAFMIDFDYVVPSFFLADLAQLLKFQYLDKISIADVLLERFLKGSMQAVSLPSLENYKGLFSLAIANSSIASMQYSKNLSSTTRMRLVRGTISHLKRMEILE